MADTLVQSLGSLVQERKALQRKEQQLAQRQLQVIRGLDQLLRLSVEAVGECQGADDFSQWRSQDTGSQAAQVPEVGPPICAPSPTGSACECLPSSNEAEASGEDGEEKLIPQHTDTGSAWPLNYLLPFGPRRSAVSGRQTRKGLMSVVACANA